MHKVTPEGEVRALISRDMETQPVFIGDKVRLPYAGGDVVTVDYESLSTGSTWIRSVSVLHRTEPGTVWPERVRCYNDSNGRIYECGKPVTVMGIDLNVDYSFIRSDGVAINYDIEDVRIFGFPVTPDEELRNRIINILEDEA